LKRFFSPLLFLMANAPNAEKNLDSLMYALQATLESVKNIKTGIDSFHASFLQMAEAVKGPEPGYSPAGTKPSVQTEKTGVKPEPPAEPVTTSEPLPSIQMPPSTGEPAS